MLNSLMQNAVIWLILSLCTIGSMVWGIYTWWSNKQCKEISYEYETTEVIKAGKCFSDKLDIRFAGNSITDLSVTKFYIWNSGTEIINREDIVTAKPLTIRGNKRTVLLEADVVYSNEATNEFRVEKLLNETLVLSFDYIAKRQGIILQVLHTGSAENLLVDCTIKGGEKVKNPSNPMQHTQVRKLLRVLSAAYQSMSAYVGLFLAIPIVEKIDTLSTDNASKVVLSIAIMVGLAFLSVSFSRWLRKSIRNHNPHVVPLSLKNAYIAMPFKMSKNNRHYAFVQNHIKNRYGE